MLSIRTMRTRFNSLCDFYDSFSRQLESEAKSRRVEFRVITKAYNNIKQIIDSDILKIDRKDLRVEQ